MCKFGQYCKSSQPVMVCTSETESKARVQVESSGYNSFDEDEDLIIFTSPKETAHSEALEKKVCAKQSDSRLTFVAHVVSYPAQTFTTCENLVSNHCF